MNNKYIQIIFLHLQGIVLFPTLKVIFNSHLCKTILSKNTFTIKDLEQNSQLNIGYLNIALRTLRSCNLLDCKTSSKKELQNEYIATNVLINLYKINDEINLFFNLLPYHKNFNKLSNEDFVNYTSLLNKAYEFLYKIKLEKILPNEIYYKLEGVILGPLLNNLIYYGYLENLNKDNFVIKNLNDDFRNIVENIFLLSEMICIRSENYKITNKGIYFFKKGSAYGVTCSYLETIFRIEDLIFGDCRFIWDRDENNHEIHVNRSMNVWGSGGAHKNYFKKIDKIIIDIFNQDLPKQPKGIIDIGCGDGTFLKHVYNIILNNTVRGENLKDYPLNVVGVDINKAARTVARNTLNTENIDNIICNGNIGDPSHINKTLTETFKIDLKDLLNMRTFLDHNRIYEPPKNLIKNEINTSGSFCFKGQYISSNELINNLIEHFTKWKPYIKNYGLIILELHTLNPKLTKTIQNLTPCIAYDATHGYSDQYLIEHEVFIKVLKTLSFYIDLEHQSLFPNKDYPTISVNYIK